MNGVGLDFYGRLDKCGLLNNGNIGIPLWWDEPQDKSHVLDLVLGSMLPDLLALKFLGLYNMLNSLYLHISTCGSCRFTFHWLKFLVGLISIFP